MRYWWEEEGLRFECRACGACCGGEPGDIWVTRGEREKIASALGVGEAEFEREYLTRKGGGFSIKERADYDCIFLERNSRRCKVYKIRPLQCRLFPFWPSMLTDKNVWDFYAERCAGMNAGKYYPKEIIKRFLNLRSAKNL